MGLKRFVPEAFHESFNQESTIQESFKCFGYISVQNICLHEFKVVFKGRGAKVPGLTTADPVEELDSCHNGNEIRLAGCVGQITGLSLAIECCLDKNSQGVHAMAEQYKVNGY